MIGYFNFFGVPSVHSSARLKDPCNGVKLTLLYFTEYMEHLTLTVIGYHSRSSPNLHEDHRPVQANI